MPKPLNLQLLTQSGLARNDNFIENNLRGRLSSNRDVQTVLSKLTRDWVHTPVAKWRND